MSTVSVYVCDGCGHRLEGLSATPPMWRKYAALTYGNPSSHDGYQVVERYDDLCGGCFEEILKAVRDTLASRRVVATAVKGEKR